MALVESTEIDKIEVVGPHKAVQVRKALVVKKDGVEIARSLERYSLTPGQLKGTTNADGSPASDAQDFVDNDISAMNLEPEKCEKWEWYNNNNIPSEQFIPLKNYLEKYDKI